jgi:hypothetical protein
LSLNMNINNNPGIVQPVVYSEESTTKDASLCLSGNLWLIVKPTSHATIISHSPRTLKHHYICITVPFRHLWLIVKSTSHAMIISHSPRTLTLGRRNERKEIT